MPLVEAFLVFKERGGWGKLSPRLGTLEPNSQSCSDFEGVICGQPLRRARDNILITDLRHLRKSFLATSTAWEGRGRNYQVCAEPEKQPAEV